MIASMCYSTPDATVQRIVAFQQAQNWTNNRFAVEAGLPSNTLKRIGRPDWNPTLRVLRTLSAVIPDSFCPERKRGPRKKKG